MDNQSVIEKIDNLIEDYKLEEALKLIEEALAKKDKDLDILCLKGKIMSKKQQYGDALNIYQHVLQLSPENEKALSSIKMINNILSIRRSFYFENTYTNDELYE